MSQGKYFKLNENENTVYKNLWNEANAVSREREIISISRFSYKDRSHKSFKKYILDKSPL
jgi:hypothetical protein